LACNSIKLSLYTPRRCGGSGCVTPLILNFGTTCWCVVSLTTWRLYPRRKNVVDIQKAKRRSCVSNTKAQRRMGNRRSSRCWIGNGYSHLRSTHFIPMTLIIMPALQQAVETILILEAVARKNILPVLRTEPLHCS
jgi:hypothetical protein